MKLGEVHTDLIETLKNLGIYNCHITGCKNKPTEVHAISLTEDGKKTTLYCDEHSKRECQIDGCNNVGYPDNTVIGMGGDIKVAWFCDKHWKEWNA